MLILNNCYLLYVLKRANARFSIFKLLIFYQIQETSEENVLRLSCQDLGPSGSSSHADDANQEILCPAVCDPSLHIG